MALRRLSGFDLDQLTADELALFRERVELLLVDHQRGKRVGVELPGRTYTLGPSQANGQFRGSVALPPSIPAGSVVFRLATTPHSVPEAAGVIHLLEPQGLSVLSDIDDTIKVSQVRDREELLRNTLCRPFQAVPGMAAVYQSWAAGGAQFHYVSASPWQLCGPLAEFVRASGFPAGSFHLRQVRLKDGTFLDLLKSPEAHKRSAITSLLRRYPGRRFVLVGDSGEQDPEIYAALARTHPRQIQRILIRDVTRESASAGRYQRVFAGLPSGQCRVFTDPAEIRPAVR